MGSHKGTVYAAIIAGLVVVNGAATAQAQVVKFSSINDAVPLMFFSAAASAPAPSNPNRLIIGFNSGFDPTTFLANDFRASTLSFSHRTAMDTISFKIKAPLGFYVSKITYTQRGTGFSGRTSSSSGGATWVVAGHSASLGIFSTDPTLIGTANVKAMKLTSVPVSITVSLFAGSGSVAVTSADVLVEVLPLLP